MPWHCTMSINLKSLQMSNPQARKTKMVDVMCSPRKITLTTWDKALNSARSTRVWAYRRTGRVAIPRKMTIRYSTLACKTSDFGRWALSISHYKNWQSQVWLIKICHFIDLLKILNAHENSSHPQAKKKSQIVKSSTSKWTKQVCTVSFYAQMPFSTQISIRTPCMRS